MSVRAEAAVGQQQVAGLQMRVHFVRARQIVDAPTRHEHVDQRSRVRVEER